MFQDTQLLKPFQENKRAKHAQDKLKANWSSVPNNFVMCIQIVQW